MTITALVPAPDCVQLLVVWLLGGKIMRNRLWFLNRQPPTTALQVQALTDAAAAYWVSEFLPLLSDQVTLSFVEALQWDVPNAGALGFTSVGLPGGVAEKSYSASVAIRVPFRWPLNVNLRQNSNFVGGIPDSAVLVNTPDETYLESLRDAYNGIIDAAPVWGSFPAWWWIVASLEDNLTPRSEALIALSIGVASGYATCVSPRRMRVR